MAKQLVMIAPFEALRGNVSGAQKLKYPAHNNSAWDSPNGRQYARNYAARYVAMQRASDGKLYYAVRRRAAVLVTNGTKARWATFGGTAAVYASMLQDARLISPMNALYAAQGRGKTMRQFFTPGIQNMLDNQSPTAAWANTVKINNPWNDTQASGFVTPVISDETLQKFQPYLGA